MADKRPLKIENGVVKEIGPPDTIPADILPASSGTSVATLFLLMGG